MEASEFLHLAPEPLHEPLAFPYPRLLASQGATQPRHKVGCLQGTQRASSAQRKVGYTQGR